MLEFKVSGPVTGLGRHSVTWASNRIARLSTSNGAPKLLRGVHSRAFATKACHDRLRQRACAGARAGGGGWDNMAYSSSARCLELSIGGFRAEG